MARGNRVPLLVALPAVVAAGWLAVTQLSPPAAASMPALSLAEALREDLIEVAFASIRAGQDPNQPIPFRNERLTGGDQLLLTPLVIAVGNGRADSVMMLMSSGARLDAPGNRFARCLAERLGHDGIVGILERDGGEAGASVICPDAPHDDAAPLRAYAF